MRRLILLTFIFCLTLHAQGQPSEKLLDSLSYFPRALYSEVGNKLDSLMFIWSSKMLREFDEPKLLSIEGKSAYRFTWTRSFHEVVVIRLEISGDSGTIITKTEILEPIQQSTKAKKIETPKKMRYRTDIAKIPADTLTKFQEIINANRFWELRNTWVLFVSHDGASWLLEANDKEKGYKMLYRHSPKEQEKSFKDICLFLVRLTKTPID